MSKGASKGKRPGARRKPGARQRLLVLAVTEDEATECFNFIRVTVARPAVFSLSVKTLDAVERVMRGVVNSWIVQS